MTPEDKRLDRIEEKLDRVAQALESLARIDERMMSLFRRMDVYDASQQDLTKRVTLLETNSSGQSATVGWIERVAWFVVVGGLTLLLSPIIT